LEVYKHIVFLRYSSSPHLQFYLKRSVF
jgi:hypothetical protein